jgi:DNA primase
MNSENLVKHPILINLLVSVLGDFRKHHVSQMQMAFNCPTCAQLKGVIADNKYNLEVHYGKGMYNCWACGKSQGTHGTIYDLFDTFGSKQDLSIYQSLNMGYEYTTDDGEEGVRVDRKIIIPPEYIPLADKESLGVYRKAYNYLRQRGITNEIIKKFSIGWCYDGKYADRILIPSMDDEGNWDYFTTRAMDKNVKPKYLNCDADKEYVVFNENLVNWDKWVFLVEGPFDHIVTPNSIPMLGKGIYPLLHRMIYDNATNKVVVLVDPDAVDDGIAFYRQLDGGKLLGRVLINFMPKYYDPAKYFEKYGFENYKRQLTQSYRLKD